MHWKLKKIFSLWWRATTQEWNLGSFYAKIEMCYFKKLNISFMRSKRSSKNNKQEEERIILFNAKWKHYKMFGLEKYQLIFHWCFQNIFLCEKVFFLCAYSHFEMKIKRIKKIDMKERHVKGWKIVTFRQSGRFSINLFLFFNILFSLGPKKGEKAKTEKLKKVITSELRKTHFLKTVLMNREKTNRED